MRHQAIPVRLRLLPSFVLLASVSVVLAAPVSKRLKPEDILTIPRLSDVQISPSGKWAAFVVSKPADLSKNPRSEASSIWTVTVQGVGTARPVAPKLGRQSMPRWSHDGRYLAFLAASSASSPERAYGSQIYFVKSSGGVPRRLTNTQGGVGLFKWSPTGRTIAFTAQMSASTAPSALFKGDDAIEVGRGYKFSHLWTVQISNSQTRELTRENLQVNDFDWSPDGSELALRVSTTPRLDDEFWHSRLMIVRRTTGQITRTISDHISPWEGSLRWSPDGHSIAFPEFTPGRIASWLTLESLADASKRYVLKDYPATVRAEEWARDGRHLWVEAIAGTRISLLRVDPVTMKVEKVISGAASSGFSIARNGKTVAYLCQKTNGPPEVCALYMPGAVRQLTHFAANLPLEELGTTRQISWKSTKDGRDIYGILITPPGFKSHQPWPTVVVVHGGPMMAWSSGWNSWGELLASNGYVVLLPNPRGSEGQGWKFAELDVDDWGGGDFQDILDGVDYLTREHIADPGRLGIGGWSFGGFMTAWAVTHTHRFKAAVEGAGLTDLLSFDGSAEISPSFLEVYFRGTPFDHRYVYARHSPAYFLSYCETPTLIMHGLADTVVPVNQSWEFYRGLRMLGVQTELVLYPREWHVFGEPVHQLDVLARLLAWYNKYLEVSGPVSCGRYPKTQIKCVSRAALYASPFG
jgi:dipeptidyl aminopeptidase/acylaminoacyl peptidase